MNQIVRFTKWLIFTNTYIAIAAVCFQGVFFFISEAGNWSWVLSIHTFFSTLLIYQFSRYNFHRTYDHSQNVKDEIYQFLDNNLGKTKLVILGSGIVTLFTLFFLRLETILLIGCLGAVSVLYPIKLPEKYGGFSLRSIPFTKIFLIAIVWSFMSVWVPYLELASNLNMQDFLPLFIFQFLFILFITLPFDMADLEVDDKTGVKTIPNQLGIKGTKILIMCLAAGLLILGWSTFQGILNDLPYLLLSLLIIALSLYSIRNKAHYLKWKVMAIYDGSMIVFYLIFLISYQITLWI